jgi:hypothetical protein
MVSARSRKRSETAVSVPTFPSITTDLCGPRATRSGRKPAKKAGSFSGPRLDQHVVSAGFVLSSDVLKFLPVSFTIEAIHTSCSCGGASPTCTYTNPPLSTNRAKSRLTHSSILNSKRSDRKLWKAGEHLYLPVSTCYRSQTRCQRRVNRGSCSMRRSSRQLISSSRASFCRSISRLAWS